ncbi:ferredoxin subunits [alpha proteobacterium U9-1i]|nr:ferredoxin subunits [alpha proteobacterium U9-1i]
MKPPRPAPGAELARVEDVPDNGAIALHFENDSVLLTRRGAEVFAYVNLCPHSYYHLDREDGRVLVQEQRFIVCPHHGASFELTSGACAGGPCNGEGLQTIAIDVRDGAISLRG